MARPIKETPTLYGKGAKRFNQRMKNAHKVHIPKKRIREILKAVEEIKFVD